MAKKQSKKQSKRQFDWQTYSKPARLLSEAQEAALTGGVLTPLLELARTDPHARMEIRARSASLYYRGASLMRLTGENPFVAEIEAANGGAPARVPIESAEQVRALLETLAEIRAGIDAAWEAESRSERDYLQVIADANGGADLYASEYVVIDLEYTYGKRRHDLVALRRYEGVTGPGGFAHPALTFIDVRCPGQALGGTNGMDAVGADLAEFAKALGGSHLARSAAEIAELVAQKVRLGLLPADLAVRSLGDSLPELLVLFAGFDVADRTHDTAIISLHEKLTARHYPTDLLHFAHMPRVGDSAADAPLLGEEDVMTYRQFKEYRTRQRA